MESKRFEAAKLMWKKDAEAIMSIQEQISPELYEQLYDIIVHCEGKIAVMGMGTSGIAARKIAHMIRVADFPAFYLSPGDCAHGGLGAVNEKDIIIAISRGGLTDEIISIIPSIKRKHVFLIVVTGDENSPMALQADKLVKLCVPSSDRMGMTANSDIIATIALFDAIADELTNREGYSEEVLYYNHIHGGVGAKLKQKLHIEDK